MPQRSKIGVFHPQGETIYILEGADGSYFTGICADMEKELERVPQIKHFTKPGRLPAKVVFKEEHIPFREAYLKFKYLRSMNRIYRKKLIDTKLWPASKRLKSLILNKMEKHLEEEAKK